MWQLIVNTSRYHVTIHFQLLDHILRWSFNFTCNLLFCWPFQESVASSWMTTVLLNCLLNLTSAMLSHAVPRLSLLQTMTNITSCSTGVRMKAVFFLRKHTLILDGSLVKLSANWTRKRKVVCCHRPCLPLSRSATALHIQTSLWSCRFSWSFL